jgi:hypothetical protein
MRYVIASLAALAWGLWLGGLVAMFIFVMTLFRADRAIAIEAAPRMFAAFHSYELILGPIALAVTALWLAVEKHRGVIWLLLAFATAMVGSFITGSLITRMNAVRLSQGSNSPEFKRLHRQAEGIYQGQTMVLLGAGLLLPGAISLGLRRKAGATAEASAPRV